MNCPKCGKELAFGEICDCTNENAQSIENTEPTVVATVAEDEVVSFANQAEESAPAPAEEIVSFTTQTEENATTPIEEETPAIDQAPVQAAEEVVNPQPVAEPVAPSVQQEPVANNAQQQMPQQPIGAYYIPNAPQQNYYMPPTQQQPQTQAYTNYQPQPQPQYYAAPPAPKQPASTEYPEGYKIKKKNVAVLLGILLGPFGAHNFYLGNTTKAIIQIVLSTVGALIIVGPLASAIWSLVETVLILTENIDADSNNYKIMTFEESLAKALKK